MEMEQPPPRPVFWRVTASCGIERYTGVPHPWQEWAQRDYWVLLDGNGFRTRHGGERGKDFFDTREEAVAVAVKKIEKKISRLKKKAENLQGSLS